MSRGTKLKKILFYLFVMSILVIPKSFGFDVDKYLIVLGSMKLVLLAFIRTSSPTRSTSVLSLTGVLGLMVRMSIAVLRVQAALKHSQKLKESAWTEYTVL